jgi:hypothetical protein
MLAGHPTSQLSTMFNPMGRHTKVSFPAGTHLLAVVGKVKARQQPLQHLQPQHTTTAAISAATAATAAIPLPLLLLLLL